MLCIVDDDNLHYGAKHLRLTLDYAALLDRIRQHADFVDAWRITTGAETQPGYDSDRYDKGWHIVNQPYSMPRKPGGTANADFELAFTTGMLSSLGRGYYDDLVIGSGDGDLVMSLCLCMRRYMPRIRITTMSIAGGTSARIRNLAGGIARHVKLDRQALQTV